MFFIFATNMGLIFLTGLLVMPIMLVFPTSEKYFVYIHLTVFIPTSVWFISWLNEKYENEDD